MNLIERAAVAALTALWLSHGAVVAAPAEPEGAAGASTGAAAETLFPPDQIEQLVAPIALYPDALLAQILMASTYPLDIVQAQRWLGDHAELQGEPLQQAAAEEDWDPSVQALVFFPSVVGFMGENLDWTQDLGDAVLAQRTDVTEAVQRLRKEAKDAGTLESTEQQTVEVKGDTIVVQPADPQVVYVPTYTPASAYGTSEPPATTYYPATYTQPTTAYYPAGYAAPTTVVESGSSDGLLTFGAGALVGGLLTAAILWDDDDDDIYWGGPGYCCRGGGYWGRPGYWDDGWRRPANIDIDRNINIDRDITRGDINIGSGNVNLDRDRLTNIDRDRVGKWEHNPQHRGGVRYRDAGSQRKFAEARRQGPIERDAARGFERKDKAAPKLADRGELKAPKLSDGERRQLDRSEVKRPQTREASRPQTREVQRPTKQASKPKTREVKVNKPQPKAKPAKLDTERLAKRDAAAARPASRDGGKASAFSKKSGSLDRAASKRGAKSREGGAKRGGGGRRRG